MIKKITTMLLMSFLMISNVNAQCIMVNMETKAIYLLDWSSDFPSVLLPPYMKQYYHGREHIVFPDQFGFYRPAYNLQGCALGIVQY